MWLLHMEQTDGVKVMHGRNGREYTLPEMPCFSVDGYCLETRTIYEFLVVIFTRNGWHTCLPFRDVSTISVDTLAERYERTLSRLEQETPAQYEVKVQWECEFDDAGIGKPELLAHPIVQQSPLCTRDALYGELQGTGK